jgi:hypothetical protein
MVLVDADHLERLIREERIRAHQNKEMARGREGGERAATYEAGRHSGLTVALHLLRTEAEAVQLAPARSA